MQDIQDIRQGMQDIRKGLQSLKWLMGISVLLNALTVSGIIALLISIAGL